MRLRTEAEICATIRNIGSVLRMYIASPRSSRLLANCTTQCESDVIVVASSLLQYLEGEKYEVPYRGSSPRRGDAEHIEWMFGPSLRRDLASSHQSCAKLLKIP